MIAWAFRLQDMNKSMSVLYFQVLQDRRAFLLVLSRHLEVSWKKPYITFQYKTSVVQLLFKIALHHSLGLNIFLLEHHETSSERAKNLSFWNRPKEVQQMAPAALYILQPHPT